MTPASVLVVIPTHDHAALLPHAIRSVQAQTVEHLRLAVIGDGVGDDTRDAVAPFLRDDPRIEFHDLPKAGRTGEPHRHAVLSASDADAVTYLSDDDLLLPGHAAVATAALVDHDLVHPPSLQVLADGTLIVHQADLGDPGWRALELAGHSVVSLTGLAHRMDAYRRLPEGWRPTPRGTYTDQYMVQQFLAEPWCRARGFTTPTCVTFPSALRVGWTAAERGVELAAWAARLATPPGVAALVTEAREQHTVAASLRWRELLEREDELERTRATTRAALSARAADAAALRSMLTADGAALTAVRQELTAVRGEVMAVRADLGAVRGELAEAQARLAALRATRTVRARDALVHLSPLRWLLARRRAGR